MVSKTTREPQRSVSGRRRRRPLFILFLTAAVIATIPIYVQPQIDRLRPADAILVLGGVGKARYKYGLDLAAEGWAPTVVMSLPDDPTDPNTTELCATSKPKVQCFAPDPPTTKGEARELRRLAAQYRWRTVIVVTFRPHISRARFILEQCFDGDLVMVASPTRTSVPRWAFEYVYQTAGYARAVIQPGC